MSYSLEDGSLQTSEIMVVSIGALANAIYLEFSKSDSGGLLILPGSQARMARPHAVRGGWEVFGQRLWLS